MNTCRDCRFWGAFDGAVWIQPEMRLRPCDRWRHGYGVNNDDVADNEVLVEDDEGWGMLMGPDFGCVLWEAKDAGLST